jgi:tetratricopeptide (TPR) repeat protein
VGWLWYLGTLVPVIGLVQVGLQARADRYVYLPMIGIAIMLAWGLPDLVARVVRDERTRQITLGAAALAALASWAVTARVQVHHWRDTIALFEQATTVTSNNSYAHNLLADALLADDRAEDADLHYAEALRIRPGWAAATLGRSDVKLARGEVNAAIAGFREVLRERPESSRAIGTLGLALMRTGQRDEAQRSLERALALDPGAAIFHVGLGNVASQRGRIREALAHFRDALRLQPSLRPAANNLAWILATAEDVRLRDPQTAIRIARDASLLPGSPDPELLDTLAAAYAAAGRYEEAALVADRAAAIAEARGQSAVGATIRRHAALFRSGRPYVEHQTHATADD